MINYLKGTISVVRGEYIVLESQGIGYTINTGNPFAFEIGLETIIYTHLLVRDENVILYGFKTIEERELFLKLISVRGLGPKGAMAILAGSDINKIIAAINNADSSYLRRFPGIGPKTCQQIILDLHGKLDFTNQLIGEDPKIKDIKEALKSMGYSRQEIKSIEPHLVQNINLSVNDLLKEALKKLI